MKYMVLINQFQKNYDAELFFKNYDWIWQKLSGPVRAAFIKIDSHQCISIYLQELIVVNGMCHFAKKYLKDATKKFYTFR